jgi:putative hydrolase of the HAD superfamily
MPSAARTVWLFDLDDTLHDAAHAAMPHINASMTEFIVRELGVHEAEAHRLRRGYWVRYGATLLGLMRHHGIKAAHFLHDTHRLPGLEARVRGHRHDLAVLARLPGRKFILTNAPLAYAERVIAALGIGALFDGIIAIEGMHMFGDLRPKPDARMLRRTAARLGVHPAQCVLVEDTLAHQKAARRVGMATVWMQRWQRGHGGCGPAATRAHRRPAYVDLRVARLRALHRVPRR